MRGPLLVTTTPTTTEPTTDTLSLALAEGERITVAQRIHRRFRRFRSSFEHSRPLTLLFKIVVAVAGSIVILAGIAMLVLPGPGWLTIFLGLAILGIEFRWARRFLGWLRMKVAAGADRWKRWRAARKQAKQQTNA